MARPRALLAALLLALAMAPSQQLPAAAGFHRRRLAGSRHAAAGAGGSEGSARRQLAAAQPLTPVSTQVQGQEVLYQVPKKPIGMVVLLHKCGRSAGGWDGLQGLWGRASASCASNLDCAPPATSLLLLLGVYWH